MAEIALADISGTLPQLPLTFVGPDSAALPRMPEQWQPITLSGSPEIRLATALGLWNQDFLDVIPKFAAALRSVFADVRTCLADTDPVLVYLARTGAGDLVSWVGHDPRSFDDPPPFWDVVPEPLRIFLSEVHPGFISGVGAGFGPTRPAYIDTLANLSGFPEGIPGWEDAEIPSTRLLQIATDGGHLTYCLSPDLAPGQVALVYEGDIEPRDFATALDDLMVSRLELDR